MNRRPRWDLGARDFVVYGVAAAVGWVVVGAAAAIGCAAVVVVARRFL